jgi:hypothetical protein
MRHLTERELLDVAEGAASDASTAHLSACEACRREAGDLRGVMSAVAAVDVPEPSPLFWEHLSARVREGLRDEHERSTIRWLPRWDSPRWISVGVLVPVGALSMLILAAALVWGPARESSAPAAADVPIVATMAADGEAAPPAEDASFAFLVALSEELDWEAASQAGLVPEGDVVDGLVSSLSSGERGELHRLLQEALTPSGA